MAKTLSVQNYFVTLVIYFYLNRLSYLEILGLGPPSGGLETEVEGKRNRFQTPPRRRPPPQQDCWLARETLEVRLESERSWVWLTSEGLLVGTGVVRRRRGQTEDSPLKAEAIRPEVTISVKRARGRSGWRWRCRWCHDIVLSISRSGSSCSSHRH